MHYKKAFSLVELLVVITIIGVLAATAIPVYRQYQYRAQIGEVINYLYSLGQQTTLYYDRFGKWPTTSFGYSWGSCPVSYTSYPLTQFICFGSQTSGSIPGAYIGLQVTSNIITTLGLAAGGGSPGWIFISMNYINGVWEIACGSWGSTWMFSADLVQQSAYLPVGCNNPAVHTTVGGY